ncbi:ABC-2 transporter permease [Phycisphaerales bacterium AB-hyl4]|uniref:ABC-2 transporter permease n=1 Tax=Natronomicrosphaera hydrolytica TaxID=3242702 RepID=A0ABV4U3J8_9BACT
MFAQLLAIAQNTFTESIRQPIYVVLILLGSLGLVLNPSLAAYTLETGGGDNKLLIDLGLSTVFVVGLFLAAFTATSVLSEEVENRTVLTVVSKPVSRALFVVGKYAGVAAAIAVAFYLLSVVFALTVRHRVLQTAADSLDMPVITFGVFGALAALLVAAGGNYLYRWVFTSTFVSCLVVTMTFAWMVVAVMNKDWHLQSPLTEFTIREGELTQVLVGLVLIFQAVLILTAIAIAASTRLGQIMTLLVCVGAFLLGLVSNSLSQWANYRLSLPLGLGPAESLAAIFAADASFGHQLLYAMAKVIYLIAPNLQFLWPADAISLGNPFTVEHIAIVSGYSALYIVAVLGVAVALFQTREVG